MSREVFISMKLSKIRYSFAQAKKNMVRNGLMTFASLFTITSCLVIVGLFTALTINVNYISDQIKDQCEIQLFLMPDASAERTASIKTEIEAVDNVKEALLFTKEDTLNFAKQDMFENREDLLTGLEGDDNPFSNSYKITLKDIELTSETVSKLKGLSDVDHVENKQDVVNKVISISNIVRRLSLIVMALLLMIAIVIIANTVKLTVFNRRKEINIMKYIGATDRFIRIPFVMEGILIGFLGALISFGLMSWGYMALIQFISSYGFNMFTLIPYLQIAPIISAVFLTVGCLIGMIGSAISMRKYLKA